jgi:hypothetical protein
MTFLCSHFRFFVTFIAVSGIYHFDTAVCICVATRSGEPSVTLVFWLSCYCCGFGLLLFHGCMVITDNADRDVMRLPVGGRVFLLQHNCRCCMVPFLFYHLFLYPLLVYMPKHAAFLVAVSQRLASSTQTFRTLLPYRHLSSCHCVFRPCAL